MNVKLCKCGCGVALKMDSKGRMPNWAPGHQAKGRPCSDVAKVKISAAKKGKPCHPNAIAASIARTKGKHGFGRNARDNPSHQGSLHWIIRDNRGVIHKCDNLHSWCRHNEWRFLPDMRPQSKTPLPQRASDGISKMGRSSGKVCSWHGWTLVSVVERQEQGAPDLMDRESRDPATA